MKIKKGDKVVVISGKDKNKVGVVKEAYPKKQTVVVEDVAIYTKHKKPTQDEPEGGIFKEEGEIHISNVMAVADESHETNKGSRISIKYEENKNGNKEQVRILIKNGEEV